MDLREELSDIVVIKRDGKRVKFDSTKLKMVILIRLKLSKFKILLKK